MICELMSSPTLPAAFAPASTAAFTLPLLQRMMRHESNSVSPARHPVRALVRENHARGSHADRQTAGARWNRQRSLG